MTEAAEIKNDQYWLSVVVIGRNEGQHLAALFASLPAGADIEWLYVDSQSEDSSVALASKHGAKIFLVDKSSVYASGTSRYIGTAEAAGRWILYLDGDMVLRKEFIPFLERLRDESALPPKTVGFVGRTRNFYLDSRYSVIAERDYIVLTQKEMGSVEVWGRPASYHGGAVLYRRKAVLNAGNWNPAVLQLEEIDLHSRIRTQNGVLRAIDLPMVDHYTAYLSIWERLKLNFLPQCRGKNFYGAGQVVTARFKEGGLTQFIRVYPYPFIVFSGLISAPFLFFLWPPLPLLVNGAIALWLGLTKKWYFYLVGLGNLLQILRGLGRYKPFEPRYKRVD